MGQRQRALTDLSQAVRLKPDHAAAFHSRGQLYAARGEADLAVGDYSAALRIEPALTAAYVNRAKALCACGRLDEALADCEQALKNDPDLAQAYLVRGSVLAQRNEFARAIEDFSRMLRAEPLHAHAYYLRGVAYLKQDDPRQAVLDLSEAIRLDPNHARAYAQRAAIRHAAGLSELALSDLAHAARLDVQLAPAYCRQLGLVHAALGQHEWAVADYTLALFLDPDNGAAREGRQRAWQAYQKAPRKGPVSPRSMHEIGRRVPPLRTSPETPSPPKTANLEQAINDSNQTGVIGAQDTGTHEIGQETATDMVAEALDNLNSESTDKEGAVADSTNFHVDIPKGKTAAAGSKGAATAPFHSAATDNAFSIEALKRSAPEEEMNPQNAEQTGPEETEETDAQHKVREAAEQAKRARLALEFRMAEEARKEKEKEAAKKAAKKKPKKRQLDNDDDDDRLPLWKKGLLVAASIFCLYWIGSAALGWFTNPVRTWQPRAVVKGKALMEKGNEPLTGAVVTFHALTAGINKEIKECSVSKDGSYRTMLFPGEFVVTIGPSKEGISVRTAEAVTRIPADYKEIKTSTLKVEVVGGKENSFDFLFK
jgi:tetratricopeptide (TPR) repeat protein